MQKFHMVPDGKRFLSSMLKKINKKPFRPVAAPPPGRDGEPPPNLRTLKL